MRWPHHPTTTPLSQRKCGCMKKHWPVAQNRIGPFVSIPGHEFTSFDKPQYRAILMRGIAWAGWRENVDEFCSAEELASLKYPPDAPAAPEKSGAKEQRR